MTYTITLNPTIDRTLRYRKLMIGELNRATSARMDLSGKGVNVTLALRLFGLPSMAMGFAGGISGRILVESLRAQGYECDFAPVTGETRSNITVIDEASGVTTKLNEPGPTVTEEDVRALEQRLFARLQPGDLVVMSGNLPPGAPDDIYARLIRGIHERGALAALDTSGVALQRGCAAAPDFLKPNGDETQELVGRMPDTVAELARAITAIQALGPRRVLMSLGARGAAYADERGIWQATPPAITEVSAVGAGDALHSAGLWAWLAGKGAEEIVRWAVACGTAAALVDGTAMPTLESIQSIYPQVRVEHLEIQS